MYKVLSRLLQTPAVLLLFIWMIVPLSMTLYFSTIRYNLLYPEREGFIGLDNYLFFAEDSAFIPAAINTLILVGSILIITVVVGLLLALLVDKKFPGRGIARVMLISPFFIMPTVNALLWKNMFMSPDYGLFTVIAKFFGAEPIIWFEQFPLFSIIWILSWQWIPFAFLVFMTSLQSQDLEQMDAADLDGANFLQKFFYLTLPHLTRSIIVVVMIQTIFHLSIFAEIFVTTTGGPGFDTTNLAFLIYSQALFQFDVGVASAGGVFAIILANVVAFFLIKMIGKNLT